MFTVDRFCIRSPNNQFRIHFVHFGTNILSLPPLLDCPQPEEGHWHFETRLTWKAQDVQQRREASVLLPRETQKQGCPTMDPRYVWHFQTCPK